MIATCPTCFARLGVDRDFVARALVVRYSVVVAAFLVVHLVAPTGRGGEGLLPGHSHQGPAFDHGPRHSAYLMGGTGKVHFPVSSKDPRVEKFVEQGIGQMHGFWFVEAERSFR